MIGHVVLALVKYKNRQTVEQPEHHWVQVAKFAAIEWLRDVLYHQRPVSACESTSYMGATSGATGSPVADFEDLISPLSPAVQDHLRAYFVEGMSHKEYAKKLGRALLFVNQKWERVKDRVRKELYEGKLTVVGKPEKQRVLK